MLHPSATLGRGKLEMLQPAAVSICRKLSNAQNPAAVAELEHAVHGIDTAADYATPSSSFTGKCGDDM
jgi:acetyl esterase/lipase